MNQNNKPNRPLIVAPGQTDPKTIIVPKVKIEEPMPTIIWVPAVELKGAGLLARRFKPQLVSQSKD
jgi:hypothetical protein